MHLSSYRTGRALEYRVMDVLRKEGWFCLRSAASRSPVDVVAGKDGEILLVQVKSARSSMPKSELIEFCSWAQMFGARAEVWRRRRRKPGFQRFVAYRPVSRE